MRSEKLQTIFDEELVGLLKNIKMFDEIQNGDVCCRKCGTRITLKNLQLLIPMANKKFDFVCNEIKCVESYYRQGGK